MLIDASFDIPTGELTLESTSTQVATYQADFATAHPDNSVRRVVVESAYNFRLPHGVPNGVSYNVLAH